MLYGELSTRELIAELKESLRIKTDLTGNKDTLEKALQQCNITIEANDIVIETIKACIADRHGVK